MVVAMSVAESLEANAGWRAVQPTPVANESALQSADFLYPNNVVEFPRPAQPEILDVLLAKSEGSRYSPDASSIFDLKEYTKWLLAGQRNYKQRIGIASQYAASFHNELDIDEAKLTEEQQVTLSLARVYLSSVGSLAKLGQFIAIGKQAGRKSKGAEAAKVEYLAARKVLQDDIDRYFEYFGEEASELVLLETLMDIGNMARLTLSEREVIDAQGDTNTFVFIGSILSERLVKVSLQKNVHPAARYGTEEEDKSPTKADAAYPIPGGEMYVQVKMKWTKPTELKVQPKKAPPHIIVPLQSLRADLTRKEHDKIATIISAAGERKSRELEIQQACALSGLAKYKALYRVPARRYGSWWQEFKQIINEEKEELQTSLQTGVDEVKLQD